MGGEDEGKHTRGTVKGIQQSQGAARDNVNLRVNTQCVFPTSTDVYKDLADNDSYAMSYLRTMSCFCERNYLPVAEEHCDHYLRDML